ncbi:MAG: flagellar basal body L-ring protein FlgH [Lysobacterales bacterium CG17_big_fil_post_rev_8_21_14_2_50_64_11]|nr:MAG: flagellar basal body L-ring protein FlgH [Xanthomonadales bacterium CG17_big_fil_post_rev_8_21_14_2_50_64_11]PIX59579.1 MAG: flagellar basal body L-ring protein FlgH [Xanthomonadales bacterium CG_4_10_14_3_um_filter_64_11]
MAAGSTRFVVAALAALVSGCASIGAREDTAYAPTYPDAAVEADAPMDGSLFSAASSRELFADRKARLVGDILTINLTERTQASKSSSTSTTKDDSVDVGAPTLFGKETTLNGRPLSFGLNSAREFTGEGQSSQSNQLSGQITVTVAQRLRNGALLVRGEKLLNINQGHEMVRISGIVRPEDIAQDNTVSSSRVADARIAYTGRGTLADANSQGWLARFFNSKWMPF